MSEILFKSPCPVEGCQDESIYYWYHNSCPENSKLYISDNGRIRCDYCGVTWPFFSSSFKCSLSDDEFKKSNLKRFIYCIGCLEDLNEISTEFYFKIRNELRMQSGKNINYQKIFKISNKRH